jgi:hypothetical protein
MTQINLKFTPKNEDLVYLGWKCATTRDEPKGKVGDVFPVRDRLYRILDILPVEFTQIGIFYTVDGFDNVLDYAVELKNIYPEIKWNTIIYVHFFAYVGDKK